MATANISVNSNRVTLTTYISKTASPLNQRHVARSRIIDNNDINNNHQRRIGVTAINASSNINARNNGHIEK